jgi:hypothetical protein
VFQSKVSVRGAQSPKKIEPEMCNIASGLFKSKSIFMFPAAASGNVVPVASSSSSSSAVGGEKEKGKEREKIEKWVPPSQDKPKERPLVRRVSRAGCKTGTGRF